MIRNQKGQLVVEAVLLLVVTMGIASAIIGALKKTDFLKKLVVSPWSRLSGMIECGTWDPCGPGMHPSTINRNISLNPKDSK